VLPDHLLHTLERGILLDISDFQSV
jgi:hypothetical protein